MAVTALAYSNFPLHALKAAIVSMHGSAVWKVMLCTATYTPNQDTHDFKDDVTNEVEAGGGYSAGGVALANTAVTVTGKVTKFDADDAEWLASTITARYAVIYDSTQAEDSAKPICLYVDFGENKSSENGTFKIQWHASGILTITVA